MRTKPVGHALHNLLMAGYENNGMYPAANPQDLTPKDMVEWFYTRESTPTLQRVVRRGTDKLSRGGVREITAHRMPEASMRSDGTQILDWKMFHPKRGGGHIRMQRAPGGRTLWKVAPGWEVTNPLLADWAQELSRELNLMVSYEPKPTWAFSPWFVKNLHRNDLKIRTTEQRLGLHSTYEIYSHAQGRNTVVATVKATEAFGVMVAVTTDGYFLSAGPLDLFKHLGITPLAYQEMK